MAEGISARVSWALSKAIKGASSDNQSGRSLMTATVTRKDPDGTVWVRMAGSNIDTPVNGLATSDVSAGDVVQCLIDGTALSVTGNASDPAVGASKASQMVNAAVRRVSVAVSTARDIAEAAQRVASAVNQHFWTDDAGVHVTDEEGSAWQEEYAKAGHGSLDNPTDQRPWHNVLVNSLGILLRRGLRNLVSITHGAVAFYDGAGNEASNVTASFGATGAQIGKDNARHAVMDSDGLTVYNADGTIAPVNATVDGANILDASIVGGKIQGATLTGIPYAAISNADIEVARVADAEISSATITQAQVKDLSVDYAQANLANVSNAWIDSGVVRNGAITNAMINSVSANKLTAGTIDASEINVTNLNADNITVGTINGGRIGDGSLSLDKLSESVYTEAEVNNIVEGLNDRIDGAIETFTGTAVPTLNNQPASSWNTTKLRDEHVGDVYYVVNSQSQQNGYCYRFTKSGSTYSWQLIKDSDVTAALSRLTTAEGKITTFDSDISTLKTDTGTLTTKTESLETRMSDAEADILDKVDTTTFNSVSDTVDQHSQTISQHTTAISNKADSSTVTAVTNRVSKNEQDISGINTTIGELQDTLETKADGSTVSTISNKLNTVSDTVDGHTQTLTNVQNTLETKADSSTVSTLQQSYATFKQQTEQFESTVGTTYATKTELKDATDDITELEDRVSTNETSISNNSSAIALKANSSDVYTKSGVDGLISTEVTNRNAAITAKANEITSTVSQTYTTKEEFDNLEIGGRNLLYDTSGWSKWAKTAKATEADDVLTCANTDTSSGFQRANGWFTPDKADVMNREIVISFDARKTDSTALSSLVFQMFTTSAAPRSVASGNINEGTRYYCNLSAKSTSKVTILNTSEINATTWTRVSIGFVPSQVFNTSHTEQAYLAVYIGINNTVASAQFRHIKAEYGNKATEWTPAPEDIETRVSSAESSITQNANNINAKVSKNDVINQINLSTEGVLIDADRVEINGTAIFSAISSDVDDAITDKGYATTQQMNEAIQGATGPLFYGKANSTGYIHLGHVPYAVSSNSNYSHLHLTGRIGGWLSTTSGSIDVTFKSRGDNALYNTVDRRDETVGTSFVDVLVYTGTDNFTHYWLKVNSFWYAQLYAEFEQFVEDNHTRTTTEPDGTCVWRLSEHTAVAATKSNAVKRTQRIWYRKSAAGAPATPGTASSNWVTKADDGTNAWTKMHVAISSSAKYIYTCEQYEMADGTVGYTSVLLDNTITVIDGGNIITGTVTANEVNFADATGNQLKLFDPSDPTSYQVISGSGNELYVGGESVADFGETTRIGSINQGHVAISTHESTEDRDPSYAEMSLFGADGETKDIRIYSRDAAIGDDFDDYDLTFPAMGIEFGGGHTAGKTSIYMLDEDFYDDGESRIDNHLYITNGSEKVTTDSSVHIRSQRAWASNPEKSNRASVWTDTGVAGTVPSAGMSAQSGDKVTYVRLETTSVASTARIEADRAYVAGNLISTAIGWTNLQLNSAVSATSSSHIPKYCRKCGIVELVGEVNPKSEVAAGGSITIGTLPAGCRPNHRVYEICQGSSYATWLLTVNTDGSVTAGLYRLGGSGAAMATNTWLPFHVTFVAAES